MAVASEAGCGDRARSWARLVPLTFPGAKETETVYLTTSKFYIGRSPDNDLCLAGNMHVSGKHGAISKEDDGKVTYSDLSSNGTVVDGQKLTKGMATELKNGDEIHFVFKKNSATNVAYAFELLSETSEDGGCHTLDYDSESTLADTSAPPPDAVHDDDASTSPSEAKRPRLTAVDDLEETMKCLICQEILHCCISLQPCLHAFCGGCYAEWRAVSGQCPTCRASVTCFAKNHMVQNLVDAYLKSYPEKRRPKEALDELDENFKKIAPDLGRRSRQEGRGGRTGSYSDDEDDEDGGSVPTFADAVHLSSHVLISGPSRAFTFPVCRECPGFVHASVALGSFAAGGTPATAAASSASPAAAASIAPTDRPPFTCTAGQRHIVCWCCLQMMPDRSDNAAVQPPALQPPAQRCSVCQHPYCGAYWRCEQPGCRGCLVRLKDLTVDDRMLSHIVLKNQYESGILKDYLTRHGKSAQDFVAECCTKLDSGQYTLGANYAGPLVGQSVSGSSFVCRHCGLNVLNELAYQYRRDISDLPDSVMRRPKCHWGRNCRTQHKSADHAARYNHLCEQTRWA